uniref:MATE efflux family protein n=1 Tax=Uncultured marine euryarchaeote TaxID=257466 RepID=A0A1B0Z1X9_UNCAR|nr:MATE efflux family protein [uncultured marine euryarchaeote]
MWWLFGMATVFGLAGSIYIGKATIRPSIRLLGGGIAGVGSVSLLQNGAAYSFIASAWYGGMGNTGYLFIGSLMILILTMAGNLIITEGETGVL